MADQATVDAGEVVVSNGMAQPAPNTTPPGFSGAPADLQKDLALLAAQQTPQQTPEPEIQDQPVTEPVTPEPAQPATATATPVPDKFKNPDGTLNEDRLAKSKAAALAEYHKIESELRQAQNQRAQFRTNQQPQQQQPAPAMIPLTPFERSMAEDLIREAAVFGQQLPDWQAIAQARVMARGLEAKYNAELSVTEDIRTRLEDQERERQLGAIAQEDPWVFSPEGIRTLGEIRKTTPHVNSSREPWTAAYDQHLANEVKKQRLSGMVQTPTPKPLTAKAPPAPVGGAPRAVVKPSAPNVEQMSTEQITEYAKTLSPKDEAAFWKSRGLRF